MNGIKRLVLIGITPFLFFLSLTARTGETAAWLTQATEKHAGASDDGIPVKNELVTARCSACHKQDEKGRLTRISYQRRTPEGWEQAIKRMVRLNGLSIPPDEARQIVKYLSNHHGLAPEESRAAFYEAERRVVEEKIPDERVRISCMVCHSLGRIVSQRRTREEWDLLVNLHVGLFPLIANQGFYRFDPPPGLPPLPDSETREPVDEAVDYLARAYPLSTPEWKMWSADIRTPRLEGRWLISGYQPGRGRVYGEMTIEPTQVEDEFRTKIEVRNLKDGSRWTRTGRGIVYAGHSWRGRSNSGGNQGPEEMREAMLISRDSGTMEGRWFWGGYDEFGFDLTLRKVEQEPVVAVADRPALRSPSTSQHVTIYGANLPADVKAAEIGFGSGIEVRRVVTARSDAVTVEINVADGVANGLHQVSIRQYVASRPLAVFDKIDYLRVLPSLGIARLGGIKYPKQCQQFEAIAYNRGPDGQPETEDDLNLDAVDVDWSIEEFPASYDDNDKDFVGTIDKNGLFTPAVEGPNPNRKNSRNNHGDVWLVASYKPDTAGKNPAPLKARSFLLVTVPLFVRWEMTGVSR